MSVRTVTVRLMADVGGFSSGMNQAERNVDQVGKKLLGVGLVAGAGLGLAVKASASFEAAMSAAAAATQTSGKALDALHDAAIRYGASTQYSATEAADAITAMGKAGVSTTDILGGGLKGALSLAAAGQLSVADAADISATALTQFGLAGKDLPHVADLLAAGAGKAQGSVTDLGYALKYVGPVAKAMGVSIEETTGSLAYLAKQGIIGEQAGTSLRGVLLSLTAPSDVAAKKMAELGINVYDASGKFVGLDGVAGQLQQSMGGLTEAQRNSALGTIFGNAQITAATILYQGGSKAVQDWTKNVDDAGFATQQAAQLTDNLKGDVERLGGAFDTALISSGENANGVLREMVQQATGLVDIYNSMPGPVKTAGTALGGVTAAVGLLGGGLLVAAPRITATKRALGEMGRTGALITRGLSATRSVLLGPWGVALAAGAVGLGIFANKHAEAVQREQELRDSLDATTGAITQQTTVLVAEELRKQGVLKAARQLGVDTSTVTQSALGSTAARQQLEYELQAIEAVTRAQAAQDVPGQAQKLGEQARAVGVVRDAVAGQSETIAEQATKQRELTAATAGSAGAADAQAGAVGAAGGAMAAAATDADTAADALSKFAAKLDDTFNKALGADAAADAFTESLRTLNAETKHNGNLTEGNTKGALANRDALRKRSQQALESVTALAQSGASTADVTKKTKEYRTRLYEAAIQAGFSKTAAKKYSDVLKDVPADVKTLLELQGASKAKQDADAVAAALARIHDKTVTVNVRNKIAAQPGLDPTRQGAATGGYISGPGTGTSDSIPALLSNGEFVIRASQTAKHLGLLHAINSGTRGFARGGPVEPIGLAAGDVSGSTGWAGWADIAELVGAGA